MSRELAGGCGCRSWIEVGQAPRRVRELEYGSADDLGSGSLW